MATYEELYGQLTGTDFVVYSTVCAEDPFKRLFGFFTSLFGVLKPSARAVFQFYPENER